MKKTLVLISCLMLAASAHAAAPLYVNSGYMTGNKFLQMSRADQIDFVTGVVDGYDYAWAISKNISIARGHQPDICRMKKTKLSNEALTVIAADVVRALPPSEKASAVAGAVLNALLDNLGSEC